MRRSLARHAASLLALAALGACDHGAHAPAPGPGPGLAPGPSSGWIRLNIDGNIRTIQEYVDSDGVSSMLSVVNQNGIALSVVNKPENYLLSIATTTPALAPGSYPVYACNHTGLEPDKCAEDNRGQIAGLVPQPEGSQPAPGDVRMAYDLPKLGLAPLTLTIAEIGKPELRDGVGMVRRIKGSFSGKVAAVDGINGNEHLLSKPKTVEAEFEMDAGVR